MGWAVYLSKAGSMVVGCADDIGIITIAKFGAPSLKGCSSLKLVEMLCERKEM